MANGPKLLAVIVIARNCIRGFLRLPMMVTAGVSPARMREILKHAGKRIVRLFPTPHQLLEFFRCMKTQPNIFKSVPDYWRNTLTRHNRKLFLCLLIGLLIELGIHHYHHTQPIQDVENLTMDWMTQMFSGVLASDSVPHMMWINIDEETYQEWGEPFYTPRDKLKRLIAFAEEAGATMIIVDIDLSRDGTPTEDQALTDFLSNYSDTCTPRTSGVCAPIFLAKTFQPIPTDSPYPVPRQSFLDAIVAASPDLYWYSPLYERSSGWMIRHWRLWEPVCSNMKGQVLPSAQLFTRALNQNSPVRPRKVEQILFSHFAPSGSQCREPAVTQSPHDVDAEPVFIGDVELASASEPITRRIIYLLPWIDSVWHAADTEAQKVSVRLNGRNLLETLPARAVPESLPGPPGVERATSQVKPVVYDTFQDRIFVIGGSFLDSGDIHPTPLGPMPGALVILNSIYSINAFDEIKPITGIKKLMIMTGLIVMMAVAFAAFNSLWGMVLASGAIIIGLMPFTFLYFKEGIWLNFAIPLFAVQIHQIVEEIHHGFTSEESHATHP